MDTYEKLLHRDIRKKYGTYYTPKKVIDYILKNTLSKNALLKNPELKILDPTCGCGFFLIEAYRMLYEKFSQELQQLNEKYATKEYAITFSGKEKLLLGREYWCRENIHYHILKHCIYGADIDIEALIISERDLKEMGDNSPENLNLVCCDALIFWENVNKDEYEQFSSYMVNNHFHRLEVLKKFWTNSFDYIIGNPPYVVLLQSELDERYYKYIMDTYKTLGYKKNIFVLVIERALEKLAPGGECSLIVPDRYFMAHSYKSSREKLLSNKLISVTQLQEKIFIEAVVGTTIFVVKKEKPDKQHNIKMKLNYISESNYNENIIKQTEAIKNNCIINIITEKKHENIIEKIQKSATQLKELANIHVGMMIKDKYDFISEDYNNNKEKLLLGKDISKYLIKNKIRYVNIEELKIFGGTKDAKKHKAKPKLLLRKTGNQIICALDEEGHYIEQSLYMIIPKEKEHIFSILGQVNSKLINYYYNKSLITNPKTYPYIQHYDVEKLPMNIGLINNKHFIKIVKELYFKLKELKKIKFEELLVYSSYEALILNYKKLQIKYNTLFNEVNINLSIAESLIYDTYNLTEDEIEEIEQYNLQFKPKNSLKDYKKLVYECFSTFVMKEALSVFTKKNEKYSYKALEYMIKKKIKNISVIIEFLYQVEIIKEDKNVIKELLKKGTLTKTQFLKGKEFKPQNTIIREYNNFFLGKNS